MPEPVDQSRITVNVFANLREYTDGKASVQVAAQSGLTIAGVLRELSIPEEQTRIIFVNGRAAPLDYALAGGEKIDLFSPIGGG